MTKNGWLPDITDVTVCSVDWVLEGFQHSEHVVALWLHHICTTSQPRGSYIVLDLPDTTT